MAKTEIMKEIDGVLRGLDETKYYIDDVLDKNLVIEDLYAYDETLISALTDNELVSKHFIKIINGNKIVIIEKLKDIFEANEHWQDSFTNYENKIGISTNGRFLDDFSEVVLDFPYKDSVLKAGMTKEDTEDANESYYHETIARAEIDTMLDKKILINAKRYDSEGEHKTSEFNDNDNLIVKGNNLLALHTLKHKYAGRIKTVFLDPPYYFMKTKPSDVFVYNSNFKMSTWLVFMKNRLEIAYELLEKAGLLFITISDEGSHYLKVLTDGIFGAENFIADVTWESRSSVSSDGLMSMNSNHILVYSKNKEIIDKNSFRLALDIETFKYDDDDGRGPYRIEPFDAPGIRPNLTYQIKNPNTGEIYLPPEGRCWRTGPDEYKKHLENGYIKFGVYGDAKPQLKAYYREVKDAGKGKASSSIWHDVSNNINWFETNTNTSATKHLRNILGYDAFSNPKPEELLKRVIELSSEEGDIILDFFMGSATTQAVALKMNRQFIGIEQMDYINTVSIPRLQKVIEGEQGGVSEEVNWQGGGSFVYIELAPKSRGYIDSVQKANNLDEIKEVYKLMFDDVDWSFKIDLVILSDSLDDTKLTLKQKKDLILKSIEKNQLYYNLSKIDDENVRDLISDSDYKFNKSFYKGW